MANEASGVEGTYEYHDFTVASGTAITKGALLKLTDPRTAALSAAAIDKVAGFAAIDKSATDYSVELSVITKGVMLCYASGAIPVGAPVKPCNLVGTYPNFLQVATSASTASGAVILGHALDTAANGEQFEVMVNLS